MTYCVINTTVSNKEEAIKIARHLVELNLIACCNIVEKVTSVYKWKNELNIDNEVLMVMKTREKLYDKVEEEIKKLHSYDVPEIICVPLLGASKDYLSWIDENIRG